MLKAWGELTGKEFEEFKPKIAILPVGTVERHGDHLPLGTDYIVPEWIAAEVAKKVENSLLLPTIPYGSSLTLAKFLGTIDVGTEAFMKYVKGVLAGVAKNGVKLIVIINGHGGNTRALSLVAKEAAYEHDVSIIVINWWSDVAQDKRNEIFKFPGHAGEDETSAVMAIRPELVKLEHAKEHVRPYPSIKVYSRKVDEALYPFAVNGNPLLASAEKGRKFLQAVIDEIVDVIKEALKYID